VWGGGFLGAMGVLDFAGGTVVHLNAGIAGLVCAIVLGPRKANGEDMGPHNLMYALIGVAMQAEHDDAGQRERAPLLAVFDGERLRTVPGAATSDSEISGGYGGDIAAEGRGFVVSATRAHRLLHWLPEAGWQPSTPLVDAGALAVRGNAIVAAGRGRLLWLGPRDRQAASALQQWDNHWVFT